MQKKLTITLDQRVYEGLHNVVGRRRISQFIESLVRPHVIGEDLETADREMAEQEVRETEAFAMGWRPPSWMSPMKRGEVWCGGSSSRLRSVARSESNARP